MRIIRGFRSLPSRVKEKFTQHSLQQTEQTSFITKSESPFLHSNHLLFQHYLLQTALKYPALFPLTAPQSILEIHVGLDYWSQNIKVALPTTQIAQYNVRQDPDIQPKLHSFAQGLYPIQNEIFPFRNRTFDLVHQELLQSFINFTQWHFLIQEIKRTLQPDGWIEVIDSDFYLHRSGPATRQLMRWCFQLKKGYGVEIMDAQHTRSFLQREGFVNVEAQLFPVPIGEWGGRVGRLAQTYFEQFFWNVKPDVQTKLHVSSSEYDFLMKEQHLEWALNKSFFTLYIVRGQNKYLL